MAVHDFGLSLFLVQKGVKMLVGWIHLRGLDRFSDLRWQILDPMHATRERPKPLQLLELARGNEVAADTTVAGDRDRLALCFFLVPAKTFGEFCGSYCSHSITRKSRNMCNLRKLKVPVKSAGSGLRPTAGPYSLASIVGL